MSTLFRGVSSRSILRKGRSGKFRVVTVSCRRENAGKTVLWIEARDVAPLSTADSGVTPGMPTRPFHRNRPPHSPQTTDAIVCTLSVFLYSLLQPGSTFKGTSTDENAQILEPVSNVASGAPLRQFRWKPLHPHFWTESLEVPTRAHGAGSWNCIRLCWWPGVEDWACLTPMQRT